MLENSIFNIKPRKPGNIVITKKKFVIGLIAFLALFAILKTYTNGSLRTDLFSAKMYLALATIKDLNNTDQFNDAFTKGDFCGWKMESQNGGPVKASQDFDTTSVGGQMFEQDINVNGNVTKLSICIDNLAKFGDSARRQIMFIFILTGVLIFTLFTTSFAEEDEQPLQERNEDPKEVQNS